MQFWHEQTHRYHTELHDFKKLTSEAIDALSKEHGLLFKDLEGASARVDRAEREMDFVETQTSPRACANKADKVVEQSAWGLEERRGEEEEEEEEEGDWEEVRSKVSGELQRSTFSLFSLHGGCLPALFHPDSSLAQTDSIAYTSSVS